MSLADPQYPNLPNGGPIQEPPITSGSIQSSPQGGQPAQQTQPPRPQGLPLQGYPYQEPSLENTGRREDYQPASGQLIDLSDDNLLQGHDNGDPEPTPAEIEALNEPATEEETRAQQELHQNGISNLNHALGHTPPSLPSITALYAREYQTFKSLWHNVSDRRYREAQDKLSRFRNEIQTMNRRLGYPEAQNDHISNITTPIESLRVFVATADLTTSLGSEHAPDVYNFLKVVGDLGLDWKRMVTTLCSKVFSHVYRTCPKGDMKDFLAKAYNRANENQIAIVNRAHASVQQLAHGTDGQTMKDAYNQLVVVNQQIQNDNQQQGSARKDNNLPLNFLETARVGRKPPVEMMGMFLLYTQSMHYRFSINFRIPDDSTLKELVSEDLVSACMGPVGDTEELVLMGSETAARATQPTALETGQSDQHLLTMTGSSGGADQRHSGDRAGPVNAPSPPPTSQLSQPATLGVNSGAPITPLVVPALQSSTPTVITGALPDFQPPGTQVESFGANHTEFSLIETVRKASKNGYRVILNVSTPEKPVYEIMPSADLGRGTGQSFYSESHPVVLKDRLRSHVKQALYVVEVPRQWIKIQRPGELPTRSNEPITFFLIEWTPQGRSGDFAGTPKSSWVTRTDLKIFCGKLTVETWRTKLLGKSKTNRDILEEYKRRGISPTTKQPLSEAEKAKYPWLIHYERPRR
ncbi:hypothetical protein BDV97DRAFT_349561 [Delphinella strobiligena]|nr:hypothetical protein BDV97DRAFT_349561 [Delphinella strobiligena]